MRDKTLQGTIISERQTLARDKTLQGTIVCERQTIARDDPLQETSKVKEKLRIVLKSNTKVPFSIATTPKCRGGRFPFPRLLHFTLDTYLIILCDKQGGINYHFFEPLL